MFNVLNIGNIGGHDLERCESNRFRCQAQQFFVLDTLAENLNAVLYCQ